MPLDLFSAIANTAVVEDVAVVFYEGAIEKIIQPVPAHFQSVRPSPVDLGHDDVVGIVFARMAGIFSERAEAGVRAGVVELNELGVVHGSGGLIRWPWFIGMVVYFVDYDLAG
jgi:hypothetical protein